MITVALILLAVVSLLSGLTVRCVRPATYGDLYPGSALVLAAAVFTVSAGAFTLTACPLVGLALIAAGAGLALFSVSVNRRPAR